MLGLEPIGIRIISYIHEPKQGETNMDFDIACKEFLEALNMMMSYTHGTWEERRNRLLEIASEEKNNDKNLEELASWLQEVY